MSDPDGTPRPVVELKPSENEAPAMSSALSRRIRQQEILAELGVTALQGASFDQLMSDTARLKRADCWISACCTRLRVRDGLEGVASSSDIAKLISLIHQYNQMHTSKFSRHVNRTNRPNTWLLRPLLHA
jgi:hypothetical protein